jgi:hypothetical protein
MGANTGLARSTCDGHGRKPRRGERHKSQVQGPWWHEMRRPQAVSVAVAVCNTVSASEGGGPSRPSPANRLVGSLASPLETASSGGDVSGVPPGAACRRPSLKSRISLQCEGVHCSWTQTFPSNLLRLRTCTFRDGPMSVPHGRRGPACSPQRPSSITVGDEPMAAAFAQSMRALAADRCRW